MTEVPTQHRGMVIFGKDGEWRWGTGLTSSPKRFETLREVKADIDASISRAAASLTPPTP